MSDSTKLTVGYVGMGIMGSAMAANLVAAGYDVTVWNRTASKCEPLREKGAKVAGSLGELAEGGPDVICLNVSDTPDVEAVVFGDDGIAAHAREGLIIIDSSTISPGATMQFADKVKAKGVSWIDAPVSGGDVGAQKGTLSIMIGGDEQAVQKCMPLFNVVGKNIVHVGKVGMGQTCKACNQIAVSCNLLGVCEAMALARKSGLDLNKMIEVVGGGAAGSWQLTNLGPKIAKGDHDPGFMIDLVLKDLDIVMGAAERLDLPLEGTKTARDRFDKVRQQGGGKLGTQAMARALEALGDFKYDK